MSSWSMPSSGVTAAADLLVAVACAPRRIASKIHGQILSACRAKKGPEVVMNRAERREAERNYWRELTALPRSASPWEIRFLDRPWVDPSGKRVDGLLLVVEARGGLLRAGGPVVAGQGWGELLTAAIVDPQPPGVAARPQRVVCADHDTRERVRSTLGRLDVDLAVGPTPAADAAVESLAEVVGGLRPGPELPGIHVEERRWRTALAQLSARTPWRVVPHTVSFHFRGHALLDDGVAVLVGGAGGQVGIFFFPRRDDHARFLDQLSQAHDPRTPVGTGTESWCLLLEPLDDAAPAERETLRRQGWALPGGLYPLVLRSRVPIAWPLEPHQERALLSVVEAVVAVTTARPEELAFAPRTLQVAAATGNVTVTTTPLNVPREHSFWEKEALTGFVPGAAGRPPALFVKQAKRDAVATARRLRALEGVTARRAEAGWELLARAGGQEVGRLGTTGGPALDGPVLRVVVQAGGVTRTRWRDEDTIDEVDLPLVLVDARIDDAAPSLDPIFRGPPDRWPKASAVLLDLLVAAFGEVELRLMPFEPFTKLCQLGATVFSAVSLADHGGDPSTLAEARSLATGGPGAVVELLVRHKRARFGGDPRIMSIAHITDGRPERNVQVVWALPKDLRR